MKLENECVKKNEKQLYNFTMTTNKSAELKKKHLKGLLEALIIVSKKPISMRQLVAIAKISLEDVRKIVDEMIDDYEERDGGIILRELDGCYQFVTNIAYSEQIQKILKIQRGKSLSSGALETLSIICYRQPMTLAEINDIRGVNSKSMIYILMERKLIKSDGYKSVPGKPTLYGTTRHFLQVFALNSLADLPALPEIKEWNQSYTEEIDKTTDETPFLESGVRKS